MEEFRPGDEKRAFYALKVWQKLVIMLGGPLMNLVLGTVLIGLVMITYGTLQLTPRVAAVSQCVLPAGAGALDECGAADPVSPASLAGLRAGDRIVAIDGVRTPTWDVAEQQIRASGGRTVAIQVERDGREVSLSATIAERATPVLDDNGDPVTRDGKPVTEVVGFLGMTPSTEAIRQPVTAVPGEIGGLLVATAGVVAHLPAHLVNVAEAAFGNQERDPEGPASVVGVARTSGEIAAYGTDVLGIGPWGKLAFFLRILGGLNLALFVFNLIPLLPLDGGHAAGALWEGVKKIWARLRSLPEPAPVDVAKALPLAYGVAVVLLAVSALLIYADLVVPISLLG
jgi:membrane-associated protease RseP (regulator of RpoE activity)